MEKLKKYITNVWVVLAFISGSGYGTYQFFIGEALDKRKAWVREYAQSAEPQATVYGREVEVRWNILKVPPSEVYDLHIDLATDNLSIIQSLGHSHQIKGRWGPAQVAKDWEDFSRIQYSGAPIKIPHHIKPGKYAIIYKIVVHTAYGSITESINPVYFTVTE